MEIDRSSFCDYRFLRLNNWFYQFWLKNIEKIKNVRGQVGWFVFLLCLVHHHSLELINSNSKMILKSINISITLSSLYWYQPYEFACHYRVLRGTACAQIDRKLNHKSNNVTWLVSFSATMSCSFQQILVLPLNKSTAVPLASSASNGKKMGKSSQICDHRFLSIIITNQLRNIEYYRVLRPDKGLH